jgi:hypothetical protein
MTIITPDEIPDAVLGVFMEARPDDSDSENAGWRESHRQALAAAITAWENRPEAERAAAVVHACHWQVMGMKQRTILTMAQTDTLMRCTVCGDVKTETLNGSWTTHDLPLRITGGTVA